jgi:hypothetical protein
MTHRQRLPAAAAPHQLTYMIARRARHWEVRDPTGELVCLTVYKCGAQEVVRRMSLLEPLDMTRRPVERDAIALCDFGAHRW